MNLLDLVDKLDESWKNIFNNYREDVIEIESKINLDLEKHSLRCFPESSNIFHTFRYIKVSEIKVIILGQDCYHKEKQAIGLSFAVPENINKPPSLKNIEKELKKDTGKELSSRNLIYWNQQGVLLLNCALTVRESCPGSHLKIWKSFVIKLLKDIVSKNPDIIFILWGNFAKDIYKKINHNDELAIKGAHPSPLSANKGGFFDQKYFSKTNDILTRQGRTPISW